ncbi:MAG: hypothetical protein CHACPFDD_02458 [Phycisphaerae bacterium]|nr:hypothetical protein [Phycisphaerae bacterium]
MSTPGRTRLPVVVDGAVVLHPRPSADWRAMAAFTQATVARLRDEICRRSAIPPAQHDIRTPLPAPTAYEPPADDPARFADDELPLRLRHAWGQFAGFCWLFSHDDPNQPPAFADLPDTALRCNTVIAAKLEEVRLTLWRVRFEEHLRFVENFRLRPDFHELRTAAARIPASVFGDPAHRAPEDALVLYACELAGILATLRWCVDDRLAWDAPGISAVGLE